MPPPHCEHMLKIGRSQAWNDRKPKKRRGACCTSHPGLARSGLPRPPRVIEGVSGSVTGERAQKSRGVSPFAVSDTEITPLGRQGDLGRNDRPARPWAQLPCQKSLPQPGRVYRLLFAPWHVYFPDTLRTVCRAKRCRSGCWDGRLTLFGPPVIPLRRVGRPLPVHRRGGAALGRQTDTFAKAPGCETTNGRTGKEAGHRCGVRLSRFWRTRRGT